jgi:hypothetical protein
LSIDPLHYVVFANVPRFDRADYVESWIKLVATFIQLCASETGRENGECFIGPTEAREGAIAHIRSNLPCELPAPTFETRNNNLSETAMSSTKTNLRTESVPKSLELHCMQARKRFDLFCFTRQLCYSRMTVLQMHLLVLP